MKFKVFISSVQSEFAKERLRLAQYIRDDALLGDYFIPFLFEDSPADDIPASEFYLNKIKSCHVYIGIFGKYFGSEVKKGLSATESEYNLAAKLGKKRYIFILKTNDRETKQQRFISKIDNTVKRKEFKNYKELQDAVYGTLVEFLKSKGIIRKTQFDLAYDTGLTKDDLDSKKVNEYLECLRAAKKITVPNNADTFWVLKKLEAINREGLVSNAAVLLFGKNPQSIFDSAVVKCLQYWGTRVERPIPSFKEYEGGLIEQIESALSFVMSRIDHEIGEPDDSGRASGKDELPRLAVREAIVNAVCHRDYKDNGSVQVILFKDRLEIINPGTLPEGWTVDMLLQTHESSPRNKCIAKALSWAGYVERSGNGTESIINRCVEIGLATPVYRPDAANFHAILWRKNVCLTKSGVSGGVSGGVRLSSTVERVVEELANGEKSRQDLATALEITPKARSLRMAMIALIDDGIVEYTIPQSPRSSYQKYRLTEKGLQLLNILKKGKDI